MSVPFDVKLGGESGEKRPDRITESDATVITAEADAPIAPIKASSDKEDGFQFDLESKDADSDKTRLYTITNENGEEENVPEDDPRISSIPSYVRRVVNLTDDPSEPTITFRYFLLTILFVAPGAFLSQMSHFRTTSAPYSVFFVQIASNYVGKFLALALPAWEIKIPFTKKSFNLNPGPFSTKEHVLVTISAASGATYNLGYTPISMSELYFGQPVNGAVATFFMLAITWTGYSYAALARQFLIYDPQYPWFQALCQTALFETQKKQREHPSPLSRKQMTVFFGVLVGVILWQFLPEFVFPFLGSLAFLCWVAPHNPTANFIGSGFGGMGFLNLSLDWSSIAQGGSLFLTPFWTQVIMFSAFAVSCWVIIPAAKFGNIGIWNEHLMSNRVFQNIEVLTGSENGTRYPLAKLLTPEITLNTTVYEEYGQLYSGPQYLWNMFFDYAAYTSAIVWIILFGRDQIKASWNKFMERRKSKTAGKVTEQYGDQINILQRRYDEIPLSWFLALFLASFVIMVTITALDLLFVPVWTYFVGIATGAVIVIPLAWLYALSNFQLPIGTVNELIYGLMISSVNGHKNPCGASTYGAIAGDAWYRAQLNLQDMKIGHYMHIPAKTVFASQIIGTIIGIPINYATIRWVLDTKTDYISGAKDDPTRQWTGQALAGYLSSGVQLFPRAKFHLWNTTIFFSGMASFYGNISTGYTSSFIGGIVVMYWAFRYRYEMWARWNYILAAAFDAGFNFNMLLVFLCFGAGKIVTMPNWWGNNEQSPERCFALDKN
ncbi:hypothetical protein NLG97_g722 [Lecanicillium saksenae]|uniref:Uncharacterized protein n=1 Tax=Lecanicillium saksenae TaxID=468837 RepID=A0ACC1R961_9HYPO|nr:hypothetical protein NLG97_g722 [Lecanicillium saksenae]